MRYETIPYLFGLIPCPFMARFQCNPHKREADERFYQRSLRPWARWAFKMRCREVPR